MTALVVAPASRDAAWSAVRAWHYSGKLPQGKAWIRGVWEDGRFVGVVVVQRGATPRLGDRWGLQQTECVELTRVALDRHAAPVSQIVAAVLRDLRRTNPGLRLVVSFADPEQGHHGGIYQAGGWIYTGQTAAARAFVVHGERFHPRSVGFFGWRQSLPWLREHVDPAASTIPLSPKHRYVMPLDRSMRRQIEPFRRPAPPRLVPANVEP